MRNRASGLPAEIHQYDLKGGDDSLRMARREQYAVGLPTRAGDHRTQPEQDHAALPYELELPLRHGAVVRDLRCWHLKGGFVIAKICHHRTYTESRRCSRSAAGMKGLVGHLPVAERTDVFGGNPCGPMMST
jgi:hypothetical protein